MDKRFLKYIEANNLPIDETIACHYATWLHGYGEGMFKERKGFIDWAIERKHSEVDNRPDINIHKKTLTTTWNQVINYLTHSAATGQGGSGEIG